MKKIGYILVAILLVVLIIFGFKTNKTVGPNTYYQVYLDGNVIGTIKSKEKFENYINKQGKLIKDQVLKYQSTIKIFDEVDTILNSHYADNCVLLNTYKQAYNNLIDYTDDKHKLLNSKEEMLELLSGINYDVVIKNNKISNYDNVVKYLDTEIKKQYIEQIANINKDDLNEAEVFSLDEYMDNKISNIDYSKIVYMKNYIKENEIYTYVDNIYKPLGINIEKINTYKTDYISEKEIYDKIIALKPCTIEGYQIRIKKQSGHEINTNVVFATLANTNYDKVKESVSNDVILYVTDKEIFDDAVNTFVEVFVGGENLNNYINETQEEIVTTGTNIESMFIDEEITIKPTNISVKDKIYTNSADLSSFLLYGNDVRITKAYAKATDTISSFAYQNQISVEEFFLFNREFTSINNMFYEGQEITIAKLDPQISLVVNEYSVEDKETEYTVEERYNGSLNMGSRIVVQEGSNGIERVSQNVTKINGTIISIEPLTKETLVGSTNKIIEIGTKSIPYVGSTGSWGWPTEQGYTISSYFGYRSIYLDGSNFHSGIDIAGIPYGSNVYATNNGVVIRSGYSNDLGYHVMIDHNNGFYSLYAHLSGFAPGVDVNTVVGRGQVIGYVGASGWAYGTHLHYQMNTCPTYYKCYVDPWPYLMMR